MSELPVDQCARCNGYLMRRNRNDQDPCFAEVDFTFRAASSDDLAAALLSQDAKWGTRIVRTAIRKGPCGSEGKSM
jgi:hypothetical protein